MQLLYILIKQGYLRASAKYTLEAMAGLAKAALKPTFIHPSSRQYCQSQPLVFKLQLPSREDTMQTSHDFRACPTLLQGPKEQIPKNGERVAFFVLEIMQIPLNFHKISAN